MLRSLTIPSLVFLVFLAACSGPSFESGQKVWVDLPANSVLNHGYAEGNVIEVKDKMVRIQVSNIRTAVNSDLANVLRRGEGYVPVAQVYNWEEGKLLYESRKKAGEAVIEVFKGKVELSGEREGEIVRLVEKGKTNEVRAALDVAKVALKYKDLSRMDLLKNSEDILDDLKDVLKEYQLYEQFLALKKSDLKRSRYQSLDVHLGLFLSVAITKQIDKVTRRWVSKDLEEEIKNIDRYVDARMGFYDFVTNKGKLKTSYFLIRRAENRDEYKDRFTKSLTRRMVGWIKRDIKKQYNPRSFKTVEEAEQAFAEASKKAEPYGDKLDTAIMSDKDKRYFTRHVMARQEMLRFVGAWKGTYTCSGKTRPISLLVEKNGERSLSVIETYYPDEKQTGILKMNAYYDSGRRVLNAMPVRWLKKPRYHSANRITLRMSDHNTVVGTIHHRSCSTIIIVRTTLDALSKMSRARGSKI